MSFTSTRYRTWTPSYPNADTFVIWANSRDDVGLRTEWEHGRPSREYAGLDMSNVAEVITARGVDYSVNLFVRRTSVLQPRMDAKKQSYRCQPIVGTAWATDMQETPSFLTRRDWDNYNKSKGTPAAHKYLESHVLRPLAEWLDTEEGAAFLAAGQAIEDANVVEGIDAKIAEHQEVVRQLMSIQLRLAQGKRISDDERRFARYVRIEGNLSK